MEQENKMVYKIVNKLIKRKRRLNFAKLDEERIDFIKTVYNHDPRKAHHYDLVIRIGPNLSIEDAADLIVHLAKKRFKL